MPKRRIHTVPNVGDRLELDTGYGCHTHMSFCRILRIYTTSRLFDDGSDLAALVMDPNEETFHTTLVSVPGNPVQGAAA
jgi:hypothetical protein